MGGDREFPKEKECTTTKAALHKGSPLCRKGYITRNKIEGRKKKSH